MGGLSRQEGKTLFSVYVLSLRRRAPASPSNPVPRRVRLAGSGTTMLVSPLAIVVEPLKKPFPVLMVNCTVAPYTVAPVYQVPATAPVRV